MMNLRTFGVAAALVVASAIGAQAQSTNATDADNMVGSQKSMDKGSMGKGSMDKDGKMHSSDGKSTSGSMEDKSGMKADGSKLRGHSETPSDMKAK